MKIIIAGDGKVGSTLAKQLSAEGYDLTLIDAKSKVLEMSEERYDVMAVQGNCATMEALNNAKVKESDLLIAVTNADEVNLLCCLLAHGMNPKIHTIARVRNPEYTKQVYDMRGLFGISMVINPEGSAALEIERLIKYPGFLKRDTFAKGRVEIVELRIEDVYKRQLFPLCNRIGRKRTVKTRRRTERNTDIQTVSVLIMDFVKNPLFPLCNIQAKPRLFIADCMFLFHLRNNRIIVLSLRQHSHRKLCRTDTCQIPPRKRVPRIIT